MITASERRPAELAVAWLVPAVGATIFVAIQTFSYINAYVASSGAIEAITFDPGTLLGISIYVGACVLPPLLALNGRRLSDWAMIVLGGLLFLMSTLGGIFDGLRDGTHLVLLELLAVTLPGAVATRISWRHIRSNSTSGRY